MKKVPIDEILKMNKNEEKEEPEYGNDWLIMWGILTTYASFIPTFLPWMSEII